MSTAVRRRGHASRRRSPRSAAGARPVAGGTDLVVGARQGKAPLPDSARRDPPARRPARDRGGRRRRSRLGALATHATWSQPTDGRARALHGARRRVGDRRLARHARAGHDRRQRDERLAGDGHRRPAALLRRHGRRSRPSSGARERRARRALHGAGPDVGRAGRAAGRDRRLPAPAGGSGLALRPARVPPADGDRRRRRGRGRHARRAAGRRDAPHRDHGARADDPTAWRTRRRRSSAPTAAAAAIDARPREAAAAAQPDLRRPRPRPTTAARWPRSSRGARSRPPSPGRRGESVAIPATRESTTGGRNEDRATLTVNGIAYPVEVDRAAALLRACATSRAHRARRRAATTPSAAPA